MKTLRELEKDQQHKLFALMKAIGQINLLKSGFSQLELKQYQKDLDTAVGFLKEMLLSEDSFDQLIARMPRLYSNSYFSRQLGYRSPVGNILEKLRVKPSPETLQEFIYNFNSHYPGLQFGSAALMLNQQDIQKFLRLSSITNLSELFKAQSLAPTLKKRRKLAEAHPELMDMLRFQQGSVEENWDALVECFQSIAGIPKGIDSPITLKAYTSDSDAAFNMRFTVDKKIIELIEYAKTLEDCSYAPIVQEREHCIRLLAMLLTLHLCSYDTAAKYIRELQQIDKKIKLPKEIQSLLTSEIQFTMQLRDDTYSYAFFNHIDDDICIPDGTPEWLSSDALQAAIAESSRYLFYCMSINGVPEQDSKEKIKRVFQAVEFNCISRNVNFIDLQKLFYAFSSIENAQTIYDSYVVRDIELSQISNAATNYRRNY